MIHHQQGVKVRVVATDTPVPQQELKLHRLGHADHLADGRATGRFGQRRQGRCRLGGPVLCQFTQGFFHLGRVEIPHQAQHQIAGCEHTLVESDRILAGELFHRLAGSRAATAQGMRGAVNDPGQRLARPLHRLLFRLEDFRDLHFAIAFERLGRKRRKRQRTQDQLQGPSGLGRQHAQGGAAGTDGDLGPHGLQLLGKGLAIEFQVAVGDPLLQQAAGQLRQTRLFQWLVQPGLAEPSRQVHHGQVPPLQKPDHRAAGQHHAAGPGQRVACDRRPGLQAPAQDVPSPGLGRFVTAGSPLARRNGNHLGPVVGRQVLLGRGAYILGRDFHHPLQISLGLGLAVPFSQNQAHGHTLRQAVHGVAGVNRLGQHLPAHPVQLGLGGQAGGQPVDLLVNQFLGAGQIGPSHQFHLGAKPAGVTTGVVGGAGGAGNLFLFHQALVQA